MSSRLFQEVREKCGLAYSIYSYLQGYHSTGAFGIYLGTNPQNTEKAIETVVRVLTEVKEKGLSEREVGIGLAQQRSGYILGLESTLNMMRRIGKRMILVDEEYDYEAGLRQIDAVTLAQCNEVLRTVCDFHAACLSIVSPTPNDKLIELIR